MRLFTSTTTTTGNSSEPSSSAAAATAMESPGKCCWGSFGPQQPSRYPSTSSSSNNNKTNGTLRMGRWLFVAVIFIITGVLGYTIHRIMTDSETNLAETQFDSIVDQALTQSANILHRKRWAAVTLAQSIAAMHPNANDWPFVAIPTFIDIVTGLLQASTGTDIGFGPFVQPTDIPAFEEFAYTFYTQQRQPPLSNESSIMSNFGFGFYGRSPTVQAADKRFRDSTGETAWGSPYQFVAPVFDTNGENALYMFNLHQEPNRGRALDNLWECAQQKQEQNNLGPTNNTTNDHYYSCGVMTSILPIPKRDNLPGAVMFQPIFPVWNNTIATGFVPTLFLFQELLEDVFADTVSGLDCVIRSSTNNQSITYTIVNGIAHFVVYDDAHDTQYESQARSVLLTQSEYFTAQTPRLTLTIYPNTAFDESYQTNNPVVATVGVVCVVLLTSLVTFFVYDAFVRREFQAKRALLQARRQFMRYVSHEVRTPLNSVSLGLRILQCELAKALGYDTADGEDIVVLLQQELQNNEQNGGENSDNETKDVINLDSPTTTEQQTQVVAIDAGERRNIIATTRQQALDWLDLTQGIQTNAQSAVDVLTDLLNYDKIEHGVLKLELSVIDVHRLIDQVTSEFRLPASGKSIDYKVNVCMDLKSSGRQGDQADDHCSLAKVPNLKLVGDAVRITQVLRNLLSNAIKFTPEKGILQVKATLLPDAAVPQGEEKEFQLENSEGPITARRRGRLQVAVTDSGVGMSEEQVASLFRDGVQFNVNRLQHGQGSGLGLYISKSIVEQHQGELVATSQGLGHGATFTMTLPLWEVPNEECTNPDADLEEGPHDVSHAKAEPSSLRILIVDDVSSNRKLLDRLLRHEGHISDQAENGQIAVDKVRQSMADNHLYDTVLMDYEMPIMNGPSAVQEIRRMGCDAFIIGITGNMLPDDVAFFKSCGANAVLGKPVKVADLNQQWIEFGVTGGTNR